jgi:peptide/nickel transport system permease protein
MARFVLRRFLLAIPVLIGIIFVVFALARMIPGDPCRAQLGEKATPAICDAFIRRYGLDQPIPVQFGIYAKQLVTGDLGTSLKYGRPVADVLWERLPVTAELTVLALLFATTLGVTLGVLSAARRNSFPDVVTMVIANVGVSIPVFVLGLVLAWVFAVVLRDTPFSLPPSGRVTAGVVPVGLTQAYGLTGMQGPIRAITDFISHTVILNALLTGQWSVLWDGIRHMILPAVALGTIPLAIIARMTRSSLLDVLGLDYIRTARAKGLSNRLVILRHGLRNAMLPVITVIGLSLGGLLSGAVLTETIFNLAGVGRTLTEAITGRDYAVIQGLTLITAVVYLVINLLVDISYAYLDPRIRLG